VVVTGDDHTLAGLASNKSGELFIAGRFDGALTIGNANYQSESPSVYVAKLSSDGGGVQWFKTFKSTIEVEVADLAIGATDIFLLGRHRGALATDDETLFAFDMDPFVLRLSPVDGAALWSAQLQSPGYQDPKAIAVSPLYGLAIGGIYTSTFDNDLEAPLATDANTNIFVAKYDNIGKFEWAKGYGASTSKQNLSSLAILEQGTIAAAGWYQSPFAIGNFQFPDNASHDGFVVGLQASGEGTDWQLVFGAAGAQFVHDIVATAIDTANCVLVAGQYAGSFDIQGMMVASFDATDDPLALRTCIDGIDWVRPYEGAGAYDNATRIATDNQGAYAISGSVNDSIDVGGGTLSPLGAEDGWFAYTDSVGEHVWSMLVGGDNPDQPMTHETGGDMAFVAGGVVVSGSFFGQANVVDQEIVGTQGKLSHYIALITE